MPRVAGHLLTQETHPCGRLRIDRPDYDSSTKILEFLVPSDTVIGLVYGIELSMESLEIVCPCNDAKFRRNTGAGFDKYGTELEHLSLKIGYSMYPSITRTPRGLCKHCRKCRNWMKRHALWNAVLAIEAHWTTEFTKRLANAS